MKSPARELTPQTSRLLADAESLRGESLGHQRVARIVPAGMERGAQRADPLLADIRNLIQLGNELPNRGLARGQLYGIVRFRQCGPLRALRLCALRVVDATGSCGSG